MPGEGVKTSSGPVGNPGWSVTYQSRDEQSFRGFDWGAGEGELSPGYQVLGFCLPQTLG